MTSYIEPTSGSVEMFELMCLMFDLMQCHMVINAATFPKVMQTFRDFLLL